MPAGDFPMTPTPCPSCGHCPTCGRRSFSPWRQPVQPIWVVPSVWEYDTGCSPAPRYERFTIGTSTGGLTAPTTTVSVS